MIYEAAKFNCIVSTCVVHPDSIRYLGILVHGIRSKSRGPSCSSERPQLSIQHLQPHPRPANPPTCPSNRIQPSQCLPPGKPPVSRTLRSAAIGPRDTAINTSNSYNRYIAVASRVVRRSLKEDARIVAERRGVSELRFAKWEVSRQRGEASGSWEVEANDGQNGKQGEVKELNDAALAAQAAAKAEASA